MGKAVDNERVKLKATFYNNLAVAFIVTGCVVPYLSFVGKMAELTKMRDGFDLFALFLNSQETRIAMVVAVGSWCFAGLMRRKADYELGRLVD